MLSNELAVDLKRGESMHIAICIGSSCHLKGSRCVVEQLQTLVLENGLKEQIALTGSFCMGHCQTGVSVLLDGEVYSVSPESAARFFNETVLPRLSREKQQEAPAPLRG